jgi:serine protease Do
VLAILSWCLALAAPAAAQQADGAADNAPDSARLLAALEETLADVIQRAERSVVAVARVDRSGAQPFLLVPRGAEAIFPQRGELSPSDPAFAANAYATGVVLSADGLILTTTHVLDDNPDAQYWVTTHERKTYQARVQGAHSRLEMAVLKIDAQGLQPLPLGDAGRLRKGRLVVALGNPYGIARDGQATAAWGMVANLGRKAQPYPANDDRTGRSTVHHFGTLIQTTARLVGGTSGGPLVDLRGEMVGLMTLSGPVPGVDPEFAYAIAIDDAMRQHIERLQQGRRVEFGFLGVVPDNLTLNEVRSGLHGARVARVEPGTPADRSGLRHGDIITAVEGVPIYDMDGLFLAVGIRPPQTRINLSVLRDGRPLQLAAQLTKSPESGRSIHTPDPMWRGMRPEYASELFGGGAARRGGPVPWTSCVLVGDVQPDSAAWRAGLRPGMLVLRANDREVASPEEFRRAVAGLAGRVSLYVHSGEQEPPRTIVVPPES